MGRVGLTGLSCFLFPLPCLGLYPLATRDRMEFPLWTVRSSITTHETVCRRSQQPEAHDFSRVYFTGSRRCSSSDAPLLRFLSEQGINATFQRHGTHLYLIAPSYAGKLPLCFSINDRRYRIAPNDDGECEIRRLSNTDNITMLIGGTFIDTDCTDGEQSIDAILCQ